MNRNELVILKLKSLDFPMPEIRKALLKLNRITYLEIAGETEIGLQSIKKYIEGRRYDLTNQKAIADFIDVPVEDLFSDATRKHW